MLNLFVPRSRVTMRATYHRVKSCCDRETTCDTCKPPLALAGEPVVIGVTAYVLSISAVSEVEMVPLKKLNSPHNTAKLPIFIYLFLSCSALKQANAAKFSASVLYHVTSPRPVFPVL